MEDVASRAGVSRALVSIVFRGVPGASDENRARVMRAAEELSYRPDQRARLLGRTRSHTIGIAFSLHDEACRQLVETLYLESEGSGYDLVLSPIAPTRPEARAAQSLLDYRCEALILIGPELAGRALTSLAEQTPMVVVGRAVRSSNVDVVRTDDTTGGRLAVEHLIALGHQRIAHVHGNRAAGAAERRRGYRDAMRDAGLDAYEQLFAGGRTDDDGRTAADRILASDLPTAVFVYNDHCAAGLIDRLRERGLRVPDDLSIVGYDNTRLSQSTSLSLTTVSHDSHALARSTLDRAISLSEEPFNGGTEIVVPPRLVIRSSTTATPATSRRHTNYFAPHSDST